MQFSLCVSFGAVAIIALCCSFAAAQSQCSIVATNCNTKAEICGRWGSTNQCKRFSNACSFGVTNCFQNSGNQYRRVNINQCKGFNNGQQRTCLATTGGNRPVNGNRPVTGNRPVRPGIRPANGAGNRPVNRPANNQVNG